MPLPQLRPYRSSNFVIETLKVPVIRNLSRPNNDIKSVASALLYDKRHIGKGHFFIIDLHTI